MREWKVELEGLLEPAKELVAEVGRFQLSEWRRHSPLWAEKKAAKDLVTFVDRESERRLSEGLSRLLPGSAFYGEEGTKDRGELTWVVDPLDGTTNYVSGLDWFCVSVALFERGHGGIDRPLLGLVHRPACSEWYWALRGGGAWEASPNAIARASPNAIARASPNAIARASPNASGGTAARRLGPVAPASLRSSLVCTGTPYRSPDTVEAFYGAAADVTAAALDLRRMGSAALELCQVAAGRIQAFWEVDLMPYDVGAALLLLEETGCAISTFAGGAYDAFASRSLVTGAPGAAQELRSLIAPRYAGIAD